MYPNHKRLFRVLPPHWLSHSHHARRWSIAIAAGDLEVKPARDEEEADGGRERDDKDDDVDREGVEDEDRDDGE